MAVRKRFNAAEKAIIAEAVKSDGAIQWQNVTQWHPGIITDGTIMTDAHGWQYVLGVHAGSKPTGIARYGDPVTFTPGHIRVA